MVLLIGLWIVAFYETIKLLVRLLKIGSKAALIVFDALWVAFFAVLGLQADSLAVSMCVCLFVGVIVNAIIVGNEQKLENQKEREKMQRETKKQDDYDNLYGIYNPKKK